MSLDEEVDDEDDEEVEADALVDVVLLDDVSLDVASADAPFGPPGGGGGGGGAFASMKPFSSSSETEPSPSWSRLDISCETRSLDELLSVDEVEDDEVEDEEEEESSCSDRSELRVLSSSPSTKDCSSLEESAPL